MKRLFDLGASLVALVLLSPVLLMTALAIRLNGTGPILFRQLRVGRNGKLFTMLKFRSMEQPSGPASQSLAITVAGDTRITKVGGYLRAWKLDELPQLINVVRGDMSLVGPRPEVPEFVALWGSSQKQVILSVRPGITDPATIALRRESELLAKQDDAESFYTQELLPQKTAVYEDYVQTRSFFGDLSILGATIKAVVAR